jgi:fatty acyl-CoA reductase
MSASTEASGIADFFKQKTIFITGATGFIGKQLVEKLVRSCPGRKASNTSIYSSMLFHKTFRCRMYLSSRSTKARS